MRTSISMKPFVGGSRTITGTLKGSSVQQNISNKGEFLPLREKPLPISVDKYERPSLVCPRRNKPKLFEEVLLRDAETTTWRGLDSKQIASPRGKTDNFQAAPFCWGEKAAVTQSFLWASLPQGWCKSKTELTPLILDRDGGPLRACTLQGLFQRGRGGPQERQICHCDRLTNNIFCMFLYSWVCVLQSRHASVCQFLKDMILKWNYCANKSFLLLLKFIWVISGKGKARRVHSAVSLIHILGKRDYLSAMNCTSKSFI